VGDLIYFPGSDPEEREKRARKLERARNNLLDIFDHLGLDEARVEYLELLEEAKKQRLTIEFLERKHRMVSKNIHAYEQEERIVLKFDKTGRYVGYVDRDTGELKKHVREET
jgi:hypothetical protein